MDFSRYPNKLKMYRRRVQLSRKKVARLLGYADATTLSRWENGYALPGLAQGLKLACLYRIAPQQISNELLNDYEHFKGLILEEQHSFLCPK